MKSTSLAITTGVAAAVTFLSALLLMLSPSSVETDAVTESVEVSTVPAAGDSPVHEGKDPAVPGLTASPEPASPGIGGVGGGSQQGPARPSVSRTR